MPVLSRFWSWIDLLSLLLNFFAQIAALSGADSSFDVHADRQRVLVRVVEAFLIIIMLIKLLYYLRLIPQISPLISIMMQIVLDIQWFMLIFGIFVAALVLAFHKVGQN